MTEAEKWESFKRYALLTAKPHHPAEAWKYKLPPVNPLSAAPPTRFAIEQRGSCKVFWLSSQGKPSTGARSPVGETFKSWPHQ